jgi:hypothetical protein
MVSDRISIGHVLRLQVQTERRDSGGYAAFHSPQGKKIEGTVEREAEKAGIQGPLQGPGQRPSSELASVLSRDQRVNQQRKPRSLSPPSPRRQVRAA